MEIRRVIMPQVHLLEADGYIIGSYINPREMIVADLKQKIKADPAFGPGEYVVTLKVYSIVQLICYMEKSQMLRTQFLW